MFFDDNGLLKRWELNKTDYKHKIEIMEELALKEGIIDKNGHPNLNQCVYVGDDVNDLEAYDAVGLAIAFNSQKSIVKKAADIIIIGGDLTEILSPLFDFEIDKEKISFNVSKDVKGLNVRIGPHVKVEGKVYYVENIDIDRRSKLTKEPIQISREELKL